jgi:PIN domain nuclease of toxin-antitoxin system
MRFLLDTNVLIALVDARLNVLDRSARDAVTSPAAVNHASVVSLWEIVIKTRLGKLTLGVEPRLLPKLMERMGLLLLAINSDHVLASVEPEPPTRDPFDRLLLGQCQVENLRLVTLDRALSSHPLTWRAD